MHTDACGRTRIQRERLQLQVAARVSERCALRRLLQRVAARVHLALTREEHQDVASDLGAVDVERGLRRRGHVVCRGRLRA